MGADVAQLEKKQAELAGKLETRLTDYGRMKTAIEIAEVAQQLTQIYKQQLANIKRNGSINN